MESGTPFQLIDVLLKHDVPIVIIGAHAVTYHGYVRATEDIDVIFLRTADSEQALLAALTEMNAHWIGNEIDPANGLERVFPVSLDYVQEAENVATRANRCQYKRHSRVSAGGSEP